MHCFREVLFFGSNSVICPFKKLGFWHNLIAFSHHVLSEGTFMLHELSLGRAGYGTADTLSTRERNSIRRNFSPWG